MADILIFDIESLLAPISADQPAGTNLREDEAGSAAYYRIKDARSAARVSERQADAEAERGALASEWRLIFESGQELLATRSKDLEVAAWLTEAALRIHGYAGLHGGFALISGLVDRYWDDLYSVDLEDVAGKVTPLAGLNGTTGEGSLIQPLRLAPLTAPAGSEPAGLWHYMVMRKRGPACAEGQLLAQASKATSVAGFVSIYRDIAAALESFITLTARLDALCGPDSPPSSTIRNTLIEAQDALRDFASLDLTLLADPEADARIAHAPLDMVELGPPPAADTATLRARPAALESREDALRELSRIASFFREHEPNSPTAYTLQTLIRRARLPLADLLQELIADESVRRTYLNVAGIGPEVSEK